MTALKTTPKSDLPPVRGRLFYDAQCGLCQSGVSRGGRFFQRHGFLSVPLQTPGLAPSLGISESELRREMKLQLATGRLLGGVDAWSALLRSVWWLWPAGAALHIPGIHGLAAVVYRWIAAHRYQISRQCRLPDPVSPPDP
jgi:predicted DCC family thiol-disulfide oxidoreductase YuxK